MVRLYVETIDIMLETFRILEYEQFDVRATGPIGFAVFVHMAKCDACKWEAIRETHKKTNIRLIKFTILYELTEANANTFREQPTWYVFVQGDPSPYTSQKQSHPNAILCAKLRR